MTDFLKKPTVEIVLMLERNSDPSNPRRPCGSAWHEVIICEKDRINRVVAAIAIQTQATGNSFDDGVFGKNM